MNRLQFLCLVMFFSLAVPCLPIFSHAFQPAKKVKPEEYLLYQSVKGGDRRYQTYIIEEEVKDPDGKKKILIVVEVTYYTGYSFAANADSTSRTGRYTLQRVGAPDPTSSGLVITWKLQKKEGKDVLKGRLQKTVTTILSPKRHFTFQFADKDEVQLESEQVRRENDDDDDDAW